MEEKKVLPEELAEKEFERLLKAARVRWDKYARRNPDDAEFEKEDIVEAIVEGKIVVKEDGFPTLHLDSELLEELNFKRRIIGKDLSAANRTKDDGRAFYFAAGQYFGVSPTELESLETGDIALLKSLWMIFLRM